MSSIAVAAASYLWWATSGRGMGLTGDSVTYLDTAHNIVNGHGFGSWIEHPLTVWPLGYPTTLAAVSWVAGTTVINSSRLLAVAIIVLMVFASWRLLWRVVASSMLRIVAVIGVTFAPATLGLLTKMSSDGVFAAGTVLFALALVEFVERQQRRLLVAMVVLAWMLFLQRYAGTIFIAVGSAALFLFPPWQSWRVRLRVSLYFAGGSVIVPIAYFLRNHAISGSYLGRYPSTGGTFGLSSLLAVPRIFAAWAIGRPRSGLVAGGLVFTAVLLSLILRLVVPAVRASLTSRSVRREPSEVDGSSTPTVVLGAMWLGLFGSLCALRLVVFFDLDTRTANPLFPIGLVLGAALLSRLEQARVRAGLGAAFAVWVLVLGLLGLRGAYQSSETGTGYTDRTLDATYAELRHNEAADRFPPRCELVTNQPHLLRMAGIRAQFTPFEPGKSVNFGEEILRPRPGRQLCLIWVKTRKNAAGQLGVADTVRILHVEKVASFDTFDLYETPSVAK